MLILTLMIQFNDAIQCIFKRLLDVLADRKAKKGLSGHVLINGRRQPCNFKCASAYVVQVSQGSVNPFLHKNTRKIGNFQLE